MSIDQSKPIKNANDFLDGQQCYLDHKECPANASPDFQRGFGLEYEKAEIKTHESMNAGKA